MLTHDNKVFSFGENEKGQLGHGHVNSIKQPQQIQYFSRISEQIKEIECGYKHALVRTN